jgi:hypothetical protein
MNIVSRRAFLQLSATLATGAVLAACQPAGAPASQEGGADQATAQVVFCCLWHRSSILKLKFYLIHHPKISMASLR